MPVSMSEEQRRKIIKLSRGNISHADIAKLVGVEQTTVSKFLRKTPDDLPAITTRQEIGTLFCRWVHAGDRENRVEERALEEQLEHAFSLRQTSVRTVQYHVVRRQQDYLAKSHSVSSS